MDDPSILKELGEYDHTEEKFNTPPLQLFRELSEPKEFPILALGNHLGPVAERLEESIQAPTALCGQSVLAAAFLAVQPFADVEIDGRKSPISENFVSIAESGERKSAIDRQCLHGARVFEEELSARHRADYGKFLDEDMIFKRLRERIIKSAKTTSMAQSELEKLGPGPVAPIGPMIIVEEPTYEGLVKLFSTGQPSLGLFSDEGGRMIGGYGMSDEQQLKTATGLSELWDGKRITRVRVEEGASLIFGKRLSTHLMVQPVVASKLLGNQVLLGQGFLSRTLCSFPASRVGLRPYKECDLSADLILQNFQKRMLEIFRTSPQFRSGQRNELNPRAMRVSSKAKRQWILFHDEIEGKLGRDKQFSSVRGIGSKIPEHSLRLAGCLTLFNDIHASEVSEGEMDCGIALARYYLEEALRLYHSSAADPDLVLAQSLLNWLGTQDSKHIQLSRIYQFGPNAIRDAKTAKRIVGILEKHGYMRKYSSVVTNEKLAKGEVWEFRMQ
jgi:hypothetical protein